MTLGSNDSVSHMLQQLYRLFMLDCVERDARHFLCSGRIDSQHLAEVGCGVGKLAAEQLLLIILVSQNDLNLLKIFLATWMNIPRHMEEYSQPHIPRLKIFLLPKGPWMDYRVDHSNYVDHSVLRGIVILGEGRPGEGG